MCSTPGRCIFWSLASFIAVLQEVIAAEKRNDDVCYIQGTACCKELWCTGGFRGALNWAPWCRETPVSRTAKKSLEKPKTSTCTNYFSIFFPRNDDVCYAVLHSRWQVLQRSGVQPPESLPSYGIMGHNWKPLKSSCITALRNKSIFGDETCQSPRRLMIKMSAWR